ncbi:hypothetical protein VOI54_04205 [Tamlana sp. 2201CG12-4]|uniref:hypothetical protein n=1 Tax=Tamlana sp. 2201CG12-4 TaxID=3112582 RepID=UPI002DBAA5DE|nr:hypothetical protein [Tamlana sp. 2201CG12-4]MEC3906207.1 hypothetical protein [Tamlana sp. 2201CG12-4]
MNINTLGLILDVVGIWLLALDLIWGLPVENKLYYIDKKLANDESHYEYMKNLISNYPTPPYTDKEINTLQKENDDYYLLSKNKMKEEKMILEKTPFKIATWGLIGLILASIGFILQIIGSWTS